LGKKNHRAEALAWPGWHHFLAAAVSTNKITLFMAKSTKSAAGRKGGQAKAAASKSSGRNAGGAATSGRSASASKSAASKSSTPASRASASRGNAASARRTGNRANGRSQTSRNAGNADEATLLRQLFLEELRDIYWAEKHLTKALPKLMRATTSQELEDAFRNHIAQTEEQVNRVEEAFEMMGETARAKKCEAMEGLVKEAQQCIEDTPKNSSVRDAALIISAQKVEHYEIAAYGSLVQLAKTMGLNDVAQLLAQTLEEEKQTDELLTELAVSGINITAEQESE